MKHFQCFMKFLSMLLIVIVLFSVPVLALDWVYSDTAPENIQLQGGTLIPVDIEQVSVDIDGETRQQYRFHYMKFQNENPDQAQIDQYQAADVDIQRYSHRHPNWLTRISDTSIRDDVAPLIQGGVLKSDLLPEQWTEIISGYPEWSAGINADSGTVYRYVGQLYRTIQPHTTQADWTPDATPALFVLTMPPSVIAEWVQPTGAHDAYNIGDQVMFGGSVYESLIDANVWSPTAYPAGWSLVLGD